jgi:hypothetical protein
MLAAVATLSIVGAVVLLRGSATQLVVDGFPGSPLKCLDKPTVERIRSDPNSLMTAYSACHQELSERLKNFGFDEWGMKASFAALSAHAMAPYGPSIKLELADLLAEQHLDCDNYAVLTGHFVHILLPDHPDTFAVIGLDGGKVGNHAQVFLRVAERRRILADPTVGIIAATGYNELLSGKSVQPDMVQAFYAYNDPDILKFGKVVSEAITSGGYQPSDMLYYFPDLEGYLSFSHSLERKWTDPLDVDAIVRSFPTPRSRGPQKRAHCDASQEQILRPDISAKPVLDAYNVSLGSGLSKRASAARGGLRSSARGLVWADISATSPETSIVVF